MAKKIDFKRNSMPKQFEWERIKNFDEVALGYTDELAMKEASRCLNCKHSPCVKGCPVGINIPLFIKKIVEGDNAQGIKEIKKTNALPAICGRVCPQEEQCEKECIVGKKGEPIAIGRLERYLADWEAKSGVTETPTIAPKTGRKVAVVGAGPAGVTVANDLALLGHEVTIFEALHENGGVLTYGIPEFRLPKAIVKREVEYVESLGVKIIKDFIVGKTRTVDDLLEEYDAMFIASGAGLPWFMGIPGENLNGVYSANEYLTRVNLMKGFMFPKSDTPIKKPICIGVIGGGNVAMDSARTSVRLGADETHIIYRRGRSELPAREEEVENAEEEGVIFDLLTNPVAIHGNDSGWVTGVECLRMKLGEPDASGRRRPIAIEGSNFIMDVDAIVCSIGNSPNPLIAMTTPGLEIGKKGNIVADPETGRTSRHNIWAGGDVVTGAATVISAMGAGRIAAKSMHEYLTQLDK